MLPKHNHYKHITRSSQCGSAVTNLTSIHEDVAQWAKDLVLLWLWGGSAAAALIQFLAWELPYTTHVALKRKKKALYKAIEPVVYC